MRDNALRFEGIAEAYDVYRPEYPAEVFAHVAGEVPGEVRCALDVGAGTGISTAALRTALPADWLIVAVEPAADMRRVLARRFAATPRVHIVDAAAEALALPDRSTSLVTACTAFHWFDRDAFFAEAARVLVPGGVLALVRNRRCPTPLVEAFDAYIAEQSYDIADMRARERRKEPSVREMARLAEFRSSQSRTWHWTQASSLRDLIDLYLTRSTIAALVKARGLKAVKRDLEAIGACHPEPCELRWETSLKWARRR